MRSCFSDAIFDKVAFAAVQTIHIEGQGLTPATRLAGDLELGRFGRMKLAIYLEESSDVELPDEAIDRFGTVGDIARYMSRWLS